MSVIKMKPPAQWAEEVETVVRLGAARPGDQFAEMVRRQAITEKFRLAQQEARQDERSGAVDHLRHLAATGQLSVEAILLERLGPALTAMVQQTIRAEAAKAIQRATEDAGRIIGLLVNRLGGKVEISRREAAEAATGQITAEGEPADAPECFLRLTFETATPRLRTAVFRAEDLVPHTGPATYRCKNGCLGDIHQGASEPDQPRFAPKCETCGEFMLPVNGEAKPAEPTEGTS